MAEIIAIANQKGGVGKTTTAVNFGAALACLGQETLLVDIDPQGNATSGIGIDRRSISSGIYNALLDRASIFESINPTGVELLDVIGSTPDMIGAEVELYSVASRENILKSALSGISHSYSFIIVDCPPSLGLLTINALSCADRVVIPIQGEYFALEGLAQFVDAIRRIKMTINPRLEIEGGVLTMFDPRYTLSQQVKDELQKFFSGKLFSTFIPRSVRLAEAPSFGKCIFQYDPRSKGSESYLSLAGEFLGRRGWVGMRITDQQDVN